MASLVECHTASEVFENAKAVRARLRALKSPERPPPPPPPPAPIPEPPPAPLIHKIEITEMSRATHIAVHIQESEPERVVVHPSVSRIIDAVSQRYLVSKASLMSNCRAIHIARPRQVAMYLAKRLTILSYPAIGERMGRDHSTVLHGFNKIARLRTIDPVLDNHVAALEAILGGTHV